MVYFCKRIIFEPKRRLYQFVLHAGSICCYFHVHTHLQPIYNIIAPHTHIHHHHNLYPLSVSISPPLYPSYTSQCPFPLLTFFTLYLYILIPLAQTMHTAYTLTYMTLYILSSRTYTPSHTHTYNMHTDSKTT